MDILPPARRSRRRLLRRIAFGIGISAVGVTRAGSGGMLTVANAAAVSDIRSITLERSCFGCGFAGRLSFWRDGRATRLLAGQARHGTTDELRAGRISTADFDHLAALVDAKRFFALADRYEDPELRDGAWAILEVERASGAKQVFSREDAGPDELKEIEAAVLAVAGRIVYGPAR